MSKAAPRKQQQRRFGPPHAGAVEKPKNFKKSMGSLFRYMGSYKPGLIIVSIFAIASTIFSIMGPKRLGDATTELANGIMSKLQGGDGIDFEKIGTMLLWLIGLYILSALLAFVQGLIMTGITQKVTYRMRQDISEKIHRLPMDYYEKRQTGEVLAVITNDVDTLSMGLNQSATQLISSVATILGILVMMFSISWVLTLVSLLVLPLSMIIISIIMKKSQKHFKNQQDYVGHINGQIEETFGGINIVQAFNNEENSTKEFDKNNKKLYESAWKSQFLSGLMWPIMSFISNLGYVAIALLGGWLAIEGKIKIGDIVSFIQYVRQFTHPIMQMAQISNMIQSMAAASERIFEFLDEEEESQVAENHAVISENGEKRNVTGRDIIGNVDFKNVHFGYDPEKIIIDNFSANIKQGQKIAIVGPTGAGKTTLVKLLMRFYDVLGGEIKIDGYNIKDFDRSELREMFGMVLQDTWLFSGSIMENIRYGKLEATDDEVIAAAKAAHVHHFVQTLPDGYNMILNEESSNVSQGQKQLLTIARTILSDPRILILDEATSSVDTRTEVRIQKAMDNLMKGRTSFIIAHRLSTIRDADLILVMKDGNIVEQGSHEELLLKNGFYAELYNSQFEKAS